MTKRTKGIFKVTSKLNKGFEYLGASRQCEIAFRDYCNWCEKGIAPKAMQAEFDKASKDKKGIKAIDVFKLDIIAEAKSDLDLETLKEKHLPKKVVGTPIPVAEAAEVAKEIAENTNPEAKPEVKPEAKPETKPEDKKVRKISPKAQTAKS
jgi:hypothetical protein